MCNVCDNCGQLPEPFETDTGEKAYFVFSWKDDDDVCQLMSNCEYAFGCCLDENPTDERFNYFCIRCVEEFMRNEDD